MVVTGSPTLTSASLSSQTASDNISSSATFTPDNGTQTFGASDTFAGKLSTSMSDSYTLQGGYTLATAGSEVIYTPQLNVTENEEDSNSTSESGTSVSAWDQTASVGGYTLSAADNVNHAFDYTNSVNGADQSGHSNETRDEQYTGGTVQFASFAGEGQTTTSFDFSISPTATIVGSWKDGGAKLTTTNDIVGHTSITITSAGNYSGIPTPSSNQSQINSNPQTIEEYLPGPLTAAELQAAGSVVFSTLYNGPFSQNPSVAAPGRATPAAVIGAARNQTYMESLPPDVQAAVAEWNAHSLQIQQMEANSSDWLAQRMAGENAMHDTAQILPGFVEGFVARAKQAGTDPFGYIGSIVGGFAQLATHPFNTITDQLIALHTSTPRQFGQMLGAAAFDSLLTYGASKGLTAAAGRLRIAGAK